MNIRTLKARLHEVKQKATSLVNVADAAGRDLTADEATQFDALVAESKQLEASIERAEIAANLAAGLSREGTRVEIGAAQRIETSDNRAQDPKRGFQGFGEFANAVRAAGTRGAVDERLLIGAAAPSTAGNELSGEDGGFLIPPAFGQTIWQQSLDENSLLPMTSNIELQSSNGMVFPSDETTPWGSDGVRAYWQAEASAGTPTKPKVGFVQMRLHKLMALVPITDELLEDSTALGSYLQPLMSRSIRWKTNEAIFTGAGAGMPLGIMRSQALVTVAAESGQAASSVVPLNIAKMIARLPEGSYGRAIWAINNEVIPALVTLTLGNYPMYVPLAGGAGAMAGNPGNGGSVIGTLMGRPVMVTQHAEGLGAAGDIQLHDLSYYRTITKGGVQTATSMHLYFDAAATAFRTLFRVDGQPVLKQPITPAKGAATLSPFVRLAARP